MALREVRRQGDPILTKECREVKEISERERILVEDMLETMYANEGVGLAAPQVGVLKRIAVVDVSENKDDPIIMVNPRVVESDGEQTGPEGCLSVPGLYGDVTRPMHVVIEAYDLDMKRFRMEGEEVFARAMCHEFDHLDGHLYVEKVEGELHDVQYEDDEEEGEEA